MFAGVARTTQAPLFAAPFLTGQINGPRHINRYLVGVTKSILLNKSMKNPSIKYQIPNKYQ